MLLYSAVNKIVLDAVSPSAERVADIGCGSGALGSELIRRGTKHVTGITFSEEEATVAKSSLTEVIIADLNGFDFNGIGQFDCAICSHVLEHVHDPQAVLNRVLHCLRPSGSIIVALPNIEHWRPRLKIAGGRFEYTAGGIMDATHFRFFDRHSALALVRQAGLVIEGIVDDGYVPLRGLRRIFPRVADRIDKYAVRLLPGLFAWQFVITCRKAATREETIA